MVISWSLIFTVFIGLWTVCWAKDSSGCPSRVFLGCVLRLKAQNVPFEKNILNVLFNIGSQARLMHTCKVYSEIMPCFRDKVVECGNDKQRRMLNEVGKTLMFMCSPFSLERQKLFIRYQKCIGEILGQPVSVGCKLHDHDHGKQLLKCREVCATKPTDFICMMKAWISEQNVCTLRDIEDKCGIQAGAFYTELQGTVFEPDFPVLCSLQTNDSVIVPAAKYSSFALAEPTHIRASENHNSKTKTIFKLSPPPIRNMIGIPRQRPATTRKPLPNIVQTTTPHNGAQPLGMPESTGSNVNSPKPPLSLSSVSLSNLTAHYPLISLFQKILPDTFPQKFTDLLRSVENETSVTPPPPIPARETFELHSALPPRRSKVARTPKARPTSDILTTTTTTTTLVSSSMEESLTVSTTSSQTPETTHWRPWYLGGSEDKYHLSLYAGY